ncbi:MAG TPA: hypothetical protein VGP73_20830 [Thermoanaerobaculia bacterium]
MLRLSALVAVLVLSLFATAKPLHAITDCGSQEGAACTPSAGTGSCYYRDDYCTWVYPCWCQTDYLGGYVWRCGSSPIRETCNF